MAQTCVGSVSWRFGPTYATGRLEDVALSRLSTASEDRFSGFRGYPPQAELSRPPEVPHRGSPT